MAVRIIKNDGSHILIVCKPTDDFYKVTGIELDEEQEKRLKEWLNKEVK